MNRCVVGENHFPYGGLWVLGELQFAPTHLNLGCFLLNNTKFIYHCRLSARHNAGNDC
ncbi:hypothetical protein [Moraxella lacunata]|uniref:hypothetical protein n=1 Tax=Moraxella lacunata TaxID=477 RepID=UPI003EDF4A10